MSAVRKPKPTKSVESSVTWPDLANLVMPPARLDVPWGVIFPPATAPDGITVTYGTTSLPRWMYFDGAKRTLRGTPKTTGPHKVRLAAIADGNRVEVALTVDVAAPVERFGHLDPRTGAWVGHEQEIGTDDVVLDPARPDDRTRVQRIQSGALALHQDGRISDAELTAAGNFADDWSMGHGWPLRASEMRLLGVSLGGMVSADRFAVAQLDAATRFREAVAAIGPKAADRLVHFVCEGMSIRAAASRLGVSRQDLSAQLVAALQRLAEHYDEVARAKDPKPWNRTRKGGR